MISPRSLAFSLARGIIPWAWRKRLNKYRGPNLWLRWRLGQQAKSAVLSGPFRGLLYPGYSTGSEYFPKLLGTYEMELHAVLEDLRLRTFTGIVVVGGGEGYYVGGLARQFPRLRVTSFEGDIHGRRAILEMGRLNGFTDRLDNRGFCLPEELSAVLEAGACPLVVMDVERGERKLLDPDQVPALRASTVLVEVHDCYEPGLDTLLLARFAPTHQVQEILSRPRTLEDAATVPVEHASALEIQPLLDEKRPGPMRWFLFVPNSSC